MSETTTPDTLSPEILSRLMDGEWQDIDRSACVAGLCGDEASRARWARMHLARDAIKGEPVLADPSLADRVRSAIADEPAYSNVVGLGAGLGYARMAPAGPVGSADGVADGVLAPAASRTRPGRSWARPSLAGAGLAATVAIATLVGLSVWQGAPQEPDATVGSIASAVGGPRDAAGVSERLSGTGAAAHLPQVEAVGNTGSYWVSGAAGEAGRRSAAEERLNGLLMQHLESGAGTSREGLLPYSRLVGYDEPDSDGAR